jgi:hypothetical protein
MFTQETAKLLVEKMQEVGVIFKTGLSEAQIQDITKCLGTNLPDDLRMFLSEGVPVSRPEGGDFPDWHNKPEEVVSKSNQYIKDALKFDIENSGYWCGLFGDKPDDLNEAREKAVANISKWPPLVRIYGHRFMPTNPAGFGNPVLSVYQFVDTVYYGYDLVDYLEKECGFSISQDKANEPKDVPYWDEAFFGSK